MCSANSAALNGRVIVVVVDTLACARVCVNARGLSAKITTGPRGRGC